MAEWFKATVLKTVVPQGTLGSNPSLSAIIRFTMLTKESKDVQKYNELRMALPFKIPLKQMLQWKIKKTIDRILFIIHNFSFLFIYGRVPEWSIGFPC
jgi:hypothetical protein